MKKKPVSAKRLVALIRMGVWTDAKCADALVKWRNDAVAKVLDAWRKPERWRERMDTDDKEL